MRAFARGRPARRTAPRAASAVRSVMRGFGRRMGPAFSEIAAHWPEIVGARAARGCAPVKLTGRGAKGVLHVRASGAASVLLQAESAQILERVATFCGAPVAGRLKITRAPSRAGVEAARASRRKSGLTPSQAQALHESLASIQDSRLKAALGKLGAAVYACDKDEPRPKA